MIMKNNVAVKIIIAIVAVLMCIPVVAEMISKNADKIIANGNYNVAVESSKSYGFSLLYIGQDDKEKRESINDIIAKYKSDDNNVEVYYMDIDELSSSELAERLGTSSAKAGYQFIANGEVIRTVDKDLSDKELDAYISEYTASGIPSDYVHYKVAKDAAEYKKLVNSKNTVTMAVFGRDNCFYCNQFKPVYNTVAEEEKVDIYYFNSLTYDADEYQKIMDLGLKIPGSCRSDGVETDLKKDGFGTPLTLFTKNGKVIDCINGYTNKASLIAKLKTVGMITAE